MYTEKVFRGLVLIYVVVLSIMVGLIAHKVTAKPELAQSPTVSFNPGVTEKMSPEEVVRKIYGWMDLDGQRSKSILANTLPINTKGTNTSILDQVVEPKNIVERFLQWVAGIDLESPTTYLTGNLPRQTKKLTVVSTEPTEYKPRPVGPKVIEGASSRIQINVPLDEMVTQEKRVVIPEKPMENTTPRTVEPEKPTVPTNQDTPKPEVKEKKPRILIYHTHTLETYIDDPNPTDNLLHCFYPTPGRITWVGKTLAEALREKGFEVVHDTTIYEVTHYEAYDRAEKGLKKHLSEQKFDLILDIHRDGAASLNNNGVVKVDGKNAAYVMLAPASGKVSYISQESVKALQPVFTEKKRWSLLLESTIKEMYPQIVRSQKDLSGRYNQQYHPYSMIIEVGYHKNKTEEVVYSAELLANAISKFYKDNPSFLLD